MLDKPVDGRFIGLTFWYGHKSTFQRDWSKNTVSLDLNVLFMLNSESNLLVTIPYRPKERSGKTMDRSVQFIFGKSGIYHSSVQVKWKKFRQWSLDWILNGNPSNRIATVIGRHGILSSRFSCEAMLYPDQSMRICWI